MVVKEDSVNVNIKNSFKCDYFPGFIACLKNAYNLQTIETPKKTKKQLRVKTFC